MITMLRLVYVCFAMLIVGGVPSASAQDTDTEAGDTDAAEGAEEPEGPPKNCPVPDVVKVGAHVNNVQTLDLKTHTYEFDGYIWFKWCNPDLDPATTMEFLNPSELWGLMVTPTYEVPEELPDGQLYQVLRLQAKFSTKFTLSNYPFDRQFVGPMFEDNTNHVGVAVYESDGVSINPKFILPGYVVGAPTLEIITEAYPTNFGDPRTTESPLYSRASIEVLLTRPLVSQITLLMVPVLCVIVCAALMFILAPTYVDSHIGIGITALLTIVALQMTYNQDLPDVGYLMMMDKVYLASYLYILAGLAVVVRAARHVDAQHVADAVRLQRISLASVSSVYGLVVMLLIAYSAMGG